MICTRVKSIRSSKHHYSALSEHYSDLFGVPMKTNVPVIMGTTDMPIFVNYRETSTLSDCLAYARVGPSLNSGRILFMAKKKADSAGTTTNINDDTGEQTLYRRGMSPQKYKDTVVAHFKKEIQKLRDAGIIG